MESDVDQILSDNGITYPIFHYTSEFDQFQSGYVPTTIFVDGEGHIVTTNNSSEEPYYVGANDYESWSAIVDTLLR